MFKIEHKCHVSSAEPDPYTISIGSRTIGGIITPITRVKCPRCDEEFFVLGHEMFGGAQARGTDMPDGFVIARPGLGRA